MRSCNLDIYNDNLCNPNTNMLKTHLHDAFAQNINSWAFSDLSDATERSSRPSKFYSPNPYHCTVHAMVLQCHVLQYISSVSYDHVEVSKRCRYQSSYSCKFLKYVCAHESVNRNCRNRWKCVHLKCFNPSESESALRICSLFLRRHLTSTRSFRATLDLLLYPKL